MALFQALLLLTAKLLLWLLIWDALCLEFGGVALLAPHMLLMHEGSFLRDC